jgi:flagellar biosynthesis/type III secretory pathway protein FliH
MSFSDALSDANAEAKLSFGAVLRLAGAPQPTGLQPSGILRDVVVSSEPFVIGELVEESSAGAAVSDKTAGSGRAQHTGPQAPEPAEPAMPPLDPLAALRQAYLEAENVVHAARREAERLHEEARQQGYREGYAAGCAAGRAEIEAQMAAQIDRLAALAGQATTDLRMALRAAEDQLVRLALAIAQRIVLREVQLDRSIVVSLASRALEQLEAGVTARIRVHPDDLPVLEPWQARLNGDARAGRIELVSDPRLMPGGCIVEAGNAVVDAQLQTLLHEAATALAEIAPRPLEASAPVDGAARDDGHPALEGA